MKRYSFQMPADFNNKNYALVEQGRAPLPDYLPFGCIDCFEEEYDGKRLIRWITRYESGPTAQYNRFVFVRKNPLTEDEAIHYVKRAVGYGKEAAKKGDEYLYGKSMGTMSAPLGSGPRSLRKRIHGIHARLIDLYTKGPRKIFRQQEHGNPPYGKLTIYDIRARAVNAPYFFSPDTMRFFKQKMSDFKVEQMADGRYLISAPSYWDIRGERTLMGITRRIFDPATNEILDAPKEHGNPLTRRERGTILREAAAHSRDSRHHRSPYLKAFDRGTAEGMREAVAMARKNPYREEFVTEYKGVNIYRVFPSGWYNAIGYGKADSLSGMEQLIRERQAKEFPRRRNPLTKAETAKLVRSAVTHKKIAARHERQGFTEASAWHDGVSYGEMDTAINMGSARLRAQVERISRKYGAIGKRR